MQTDLFRRIKENTASGKNPLTGIDAASLEAVASLLAIEFNTLLQIWGICDSAIRHYEDEQIQLFQEDPDKTNVVFTSTTKFWAELSPAREQIRRYTAEIEIESHKSNPSFNVLAFCANEGITIRRKLMIITNALCFHSAGILAKSKMPFNALSHESCVSV
jgi:hypothetical protein